MKHYQVSGAIAECSNPIHRLVLHSQHELQDQVADLFCGFSITEERSVSASLRTDLWRHKPFRLSPAAYVDMRELVFKACTVSVWEKVRSGRWKSWPLYSVSEKDTECYGKIQMDWIVSVWCFIKGTSSSDLCFEELLFHKRNCWILRSFIDNNLLSMKFISSNSVSAIKPVLC